MDIVLLLFIFNYLFFIIFSSWRMFWKIRINNKLSSLSHFVTIDRKSNLIFGIIMVTGSITQIAFSLYLYFYHEFPNYILLSCISGAFGLIVPFVRIDKRYKLHIAVASGVFIFYTISILLTSLHLENYLLFYTATIQFFLLLVLILTKVKFKYTEVFYFTTAGIWSLFAIVLISIN